MTDLSDKEAVAAFTAHARWHDDKGGTRRMPYGSVKALARLGIKKHRL